MVRLVRNQVCNFMILIVTYRGVARIHRAPKRNDMGLNHLMTKNSNSSIK